MGLVPFSGLDNLSYTYDTLARVSTFGSIDGTATYGYDPTSQVISAAYTTALGGHQPANEARSYDPNGNQTTSGFTVGADNHLTSDGTFNFTFDPAGNLATRVRISTATAADYKTVYLWDYRNRLTDVEFFNNSGVLTQHVHYAYDVWDHLIERDLDPNGSGTYSQIVHYVWDDDNIVLAFDGHQNLTARYLNGPDTSAYDQFFSTLAEEDVSSVTVAGTVTFPLLDQQGTVRDVVDSKGNLIDHISYNLNGQVVNESNPPAPHLTSWQAGLLDAVTGVLNEWTRWDYLADNFWTAEDFAGFTAGDTNLSRVVANNAVNLIDPSGLSAVGHHYVPVSVLNDLRNAGLITDAAYVYAMGRTSGPTSPPHGFGRYGGVTHGDYNKKVRAIAVKAAEELKTGRLNMTQMKDLIDNKILGKGCSDPGIKKFNNAIAKERSDFLAQQKKTVPKQLRAKGPAKPPTQAEIMAKGRSIIRQRGLVTALAVAGAMSPVLEALGGEFLDALEAAGKSKHLKELVAALNDGDLARADRAMGDLDLRTGLLDDIQSVTATNALAASLRDAWQRAKDQARKAAYQRLPDGELDDGPQEAPAGSCTTTPAATPKTYPGGVLVPGRGLPEN